MKGVNIREERSPVCLLGNNGGVGKTSLLLALAGIIPTSGGGAYGSPGGWMWSRRGGGGD